MSIVQSGIPKWLNQIFGSGERSMGRISGKVAKERFILAFLDKSHGFVKKNILTEPLGRHSFLVSNKGSIKVF